MKEDGNQGIVQYEIDTLPLFQMPSIIFRILGVNTDGLMNKTRPRFIKGFLTFVGTFTQGYLAFAGSTAVLLCTLHAATNNEPLSEKLLQIFVVVMMLTATLKIVTIARNVERIELLMQQVFSGVEYPVILGQEVEIFRRSCNEKPRALYYTMISAFVFLIISVAISRIMIPKTSHHIFRDSSLVDLLFPNLLDGRRTAKVVINIALTAIIILCSLGHFGFAHFFSTLLILTSKSLEHVNRTLEMLHLKQSDQQPSEAELNLQVKEILDYAIQQHQRCIRFVHEINEIFSTVMLSEVWGMMFILFSVIYYFIKSTVSFIRFFVIIQSTVVTILHFGMMCYFASEIACQSQKISTNCNSVSWWNWVPGFEININIMSIRAKDPLYLKAGSFYRLNLKTFLTILELSVTYLLILLQLYK